MRKLALLLAALLALVVAPNAQARTSAAVASATATAAATISLPNIDLHDGTIIKSGSTYYLYGTEYGCGFTWRQTNTPWCGFGVSTATALTGPWSAPTLLFSPNAIDPWTGTTWVSECGATGAGCFEPRMIQRSGWGANDGVWILWFNSPSDWSRNFANPYYAMGCNSPTGPCGYTAPFGTVKKPNFTFCAGNGDLDLFSPGPGQNPVALCTQANQTASEEQLDIWGTDGNGTGSANLAGLTNIESLGAYKDTATNTWIMTYSDPNCGYCAGDGTGYATATSLLGPWSWVKNVGAAAPVTGRRDISATSCGGQADTVTVLDGQAYQIVDLWYGSYNETNARLQLLPLDYHGTGSPSPVPWQPFTPWQCN